MNFFSKSPLLDILKQDDILTDIYRNFNCPFHSDSSPSAKYYPESDTMFCFSCSQSFDAIGFYARKHAISRSEAKKILSDKYGIKLENNDVFCDTVALLLGTKGPTLLEAKYEAKKYRQAIEDRITSFFEYPESSCRWPNIGEYASIVLTEYSHSYKMTRKEADEYFSTILKMFSYLVELESEVAATKAETR